MTAVPKPAPRAPKTQKWLPRATKPITRTPLKRGTKALPRVNKARAARKLKAYSAHLRSKYWRELRRKAYGRDGGLCQCPPCIEGRKNGEAFAFEPIAIWFDTKGGIHGFDTHHTTYARFGAELLSDVLTMDRSHHRRLEASTGFRKAFLRGRK
jgi:hypothetical protein